MPHKERLYNIKEKVKKWKSFLIAFCAKISGTAECLMHDVAIKTIHQKLKQSIIY